MKTKHLFMRITSLLLALTLLVATSAQAKEEAEVLTGFLIQEEEYSLILEGTVNDALLDQLLPLLSEHGALVTFFVPALKLAEEPGLAERILQSGHALGNYLLQGEHKVQDLPPEQQERSMVRAQEIISRAMGGTAPRYLKANLSEYTPQLLSVIKEAGIPFALKPNVFLNHSSFKTPEQAANYVGKLDAGTLISFKVNQPLAAEEMPELAIKPTDSYTPQATPGPKEGASVAPTPPVEDRIIKVLGWLLDALNDRGMRAVAPDSLKDRQGSFFAQVLRLVEGEEESGRMAEGLTDQSQKASVYSSGFTRHKEVSLLLEGEVSVPVFQRILALFKERNIRATFFIPALAAARMPDMVTALLADGHDIGNYLLSGEKHIQDKSPDEQVKTLYRAQLILRELGADPVLFKGNVAVLDDSLLRSVKAAGMKDAVEAGLYLNHTSFNSRQQAEGFVAKVKPGTIISFKLNQALDASEFVKPTSPTPTPAASQQPVADDSDRATPAPLDLGIEDKALMVLDWFTQALLDSGTSTTSLMELRAHQQDPLVQAVARVVEDKTDEQTALAIKGESQPAALLRSGPDALGDKAVSLVFEGHISPEGLRKLTALLQAHQVPATFFLPGQDLLHLAEELKNLKAQGSQVGNYFLAGEKGLQNKTWTDWYNSLKAAQGIAQAVLEEAPALFKGNDIHITEDLLLAGSAAGLKAAVVPLAYLNHTSFASREQAEGYAAASLPGAILSIKMNDGISEQEAPRIDVSPSPTTGASPTPTLAPTAASLQTSIEDRLLQQVAWLLEAYQAQGSAFLLPQQISENQVAAYPEGMRNSTRARVVEDLPLSDADQAFILGPGYTQAKEVSLIIEALHDVDTVRGIMEALDRIQMKAVFFLPAQLVREHPELARALLANGHQVGNYLLKGETAAHRLDATWLAYNLGLSQALYQQTTGQTPALFKGNLTDYSPTLVSTLREAGITHALKPNLVLNATSFRSQEQAEGYAARMRAGSLITFKVDQAIDISELPPTFNAGSATDQASPQPAATSLVIPILNTPQPAEAAEPDTPALQVAQWFITALFREGYELIPPQTLAEKQQTGYGTLMQLVEGEEVSAGLAAALKPDSPSAPVLTSQPVLEKEISLVIEGAARAETYDALLALLEKYQVKALFLIPAQAALHQGDLVGRIRDAGHQLGNYGLDGEIQMEQLPLEQLAGSIYKAQVILANLSGHSPEIFRGNRTDYSRQVQQVVAAMGMKASLLPSHFVNHSSFRDSSQAAAYAQKTPWGSILSLKLNQALDPSELPETAPRAQTSPGSPILDPTPGPVLTPPPDTMPEGLDNEGRLVKIAEWLLASYTQDNFVFVTPEQIQKDKNQALVDLLNRDFIPTGQVGELTVQARTTDREVTLLLPLPKDPAGVQALQAALTQAGVKATISVNGNDIIAHTAALRRLQADGHQIVNGGFSGRSITGLSYRDAALDIAKNALLMQAKLGFGSAYYAPMMGQVGEDLLKAAHDLGVTAISYQIRAGQSPEEVMEDRFKWGVRRGDIVSLYLQDYSDKAGVLRALRLLVEDTGYRLVTTSQLMDNTYEFKALEEIPGWDAARVNPYFDPSSNLLGRYITHLPTTGKTVFLAIDDWGSDKTITRMLDILAHYNVKATFFVINKRAAANPNLLRAISEAGHSIGSHGYDHELMNTLDPKELQALIVQGYQEVTVALGHPPDLVYQPPQLEVSRESVNAVLATGYLTVVGSRLSTHDYKWDAQRVQSYVRNNLHYGAILLIHSSDNASANEALSGIIEQVRARGYTFERLVDYLPLTVIDGKVVSK